MSEEQKDKKTKSFLHSVLRGLKHVVFHNGWLKAIAVLISVVLWAGLISQDETLTRDKTFQNVNVSVTGTDTLRNNGFIVVSDLNEMLNDVSIVAAVPQKQFENAEASAYNVRLDLSKINGIGEQEIKLQSTNSSTYGKVVSTNPASITVQVEDYIVRQRIPVSVTVEGDVPEEWYMSPSTLDPTVVTVSGPKSLAQTISRAKAVINTADIEWIEGTYVDSPEIRLYNRASEEVNSPLLGITDSSVPIDSVLFEAIVLPKITFDTGELIQVTGKVAKGYEIKEIKVSPESIWIAARQDVLEQLTELPLEQRTINVRNLNETTAFQLKVQRPSDDAIISNETVTVTAVIEAVADP
jgi:YbbR domain-containing protein